MEKLKTVLVLLVFGMMVSACSSSVNESTTTHVKDLVQADVFGVLPEAEMEVLVYNNPEEIEGEYLELAKVEIQDVKLGSTSDQLMDMLKKEAKDLGGNGVLLLELNKNESGKTITREVRAVAVYALDRAPVLNQIVSL